MDRPVAALPPLFGRLVRASRGQRSPPRTPREGAVGSAGSEAIQAAGGLVTDLIDAATVWLLRAYRRGADRDLCYRWATALCWLAALDELAKGKASDESTPRG